ncbi:MAG: hypothetical protein ACJ8AD_11900 [Gemmatimonadaceae bacterium]
MHLAWLALALQLRTAAMAVPPATRPGADGVDSLREARRARSEQASFERARRAALPLENGSGGRCDVRLGRFCWWYDEYTPALPPEPESIVRRRDELVALFDTLSQWLPGDDWLAGMRVHYRIDAHRFDAADSAARDCRATGWWCRALVGYAAHARGDAARADSSFAAALAEMPTDVRCAWTDIRTLIPGDARGRYEELACDTRGPVERRYWLLGRPRLSAAANEWRNEFFSRRVQSWIARRSASPQSVSWGDDAEELLLRYGWPVAWGRAQVSSSTGFPDYAVIGHDPSPSFAFGAREELLDSLASATDDGWDLRARQSESRFAPAGVRRVAAVSSQLARFRRGDSTLLAAAYAAADDSITAPRALLAASLDDGTTLASPIDSARRGTALLMLPRAPRLGGVEVADSASGTLARSRLVFAPDSASARLALSDILVFRGPAESAVSVDSAVSRAIPGDTASRGRPLGIFWETYGLADAGESVDVAVTVERIDRGFLRSARQRLGLADEDTPLRVRWTDARPAASGVSPHAVSLDVGNLPGGRYRLTLSLTPTDGRAVTATREVELTEP